MRERQHGWWCLGLIAVLVSGCAGMRAASARRTFVKSNADAFIHDRLPEQIFVASRELMFEQGFTFEEPVISNEGLAAYFSPITGASSALDTMPKWGSKDTGSFVRYWVQVFPAGEGKSRVVFTRQEQRKLNGRVQNIQGRDQELEFALFQKLEPEKAAELEKREQATSSEAK